MTKKEVSEVISSDDEQENEEEEEEMDAEEEGSSEESESNENPSTTRVYLPGPQANADQELECDESAYVCYHSVKTGSPCLSFDIIPDDLGNDRSDLYPLTMSVVGGTEVKKVTGNQLLVMRLSNMHKNKKKNEDEDEDSEESESEDEEDDKPVLDCAPIRHAGGVNRVKVTKLGSETYAASWSELGKVHLWNLSRPLAAVNDNRVMAAYVQNSENVTPEYTFTGHGHEGFAMDWSPTVPGMLATGDINKNIYLWKPMEDGSWNVDKRPYTGHTASVEDIQWSPNESNVLASCSADRTIRVWDVRAPPHKACMLTKEDAHESDVNVISWNKSEPFILSGGDDGKLCVWDLRQFPGGAPIATFKYHTGPITSVEWHPTDTSVFAASSEDHSVSQWDLAVERDSTEGEDEEETRDLPPQLLFLHLGQREVKEVHWHRQMPGVVVSTSIAGLNVFRTISV